MALCASSFDIQCSKYKAGLKKSEQGAPEWRAEKKKKKKGSRDLSEIREPGEQNWPCSLCGKNGILSLSPVTQSDSTRRWVCGLMYAGERGSSVPLSVSQNPCLSMGYVSLTNMRCVRAISFQIKTPPAFASRATFCFQSYRWCVT